MAKRVFFMRFPYPYNRWWGWVVTIVAVVIALVAGLSYVIQSESSRRFAEKEMNRHLKGYSVRIGGAHFHPITFSLDLHNITLIQNAHPDPPVAFIELLHASIHWHELLRGHRVGDFLIQRPKFYINIKNIDEEEKSKVPLTKKGWQQALESIYPLKINVLRIYEGEVTYVDQAPYKPLHVSQINVHASNIRNVRSADRVYPSPVYAEARIFEKGRLALNGAANFLETPHLGFKTDVELSNMDLGYFQPIAERRNVSLRKGTFSGKGNVEYAPDITAANLESVELKGADLDYIHATQTAAKEEKQKEEVKQKAKEESNKPTTKIRIASLKIEESTFGYDDKATHPHFRLFFDQVNATMKNFSNQFAEGPATLDLTGKFMSSGDTHVTGTFRSETKSPDFQIRIAIDNTQLTSLSDLFRAYGNFAIKGGLFSFYSELAVRNDQAQGYVKPIFKDMQVTDNRTKHEKSIFHKIYVGLVGGVTKLLENPRRKQVATKTEISGEIPHTHVNTMQAIVNLLQNAFVKSILPGFEKQIGQPAK